MGAVTTITRTPIVSEQLDDLLLRRYVSGDCSEAECDRVEAALFSDDDTFERLAALDDGLVARYVRGDVSDGERQRLDQRFGQKGSADRLLLELALRRYASDATAPAFGAMRPAPTSRTWGAVAWPMAAAAALLLAVGLTVTRRQAANLRASLDDTRQQLQQLATQLAAARGEATSQQQRASDLATQLARAQADAAARAPQVPSVIATFLLSPGLTRGTQAPARLTVPRTADVLRLRLERGDTVTASAYRAELRTDAGAIAWRDEVPVTPGATPLVVTIPAALVTDGDYELVLLGQVNGRFDDLASYHFSIAR